MKAECGAKTRSGAPCRRASTAHSRRCRLHGGAEGSGRPIIHGRRSRLGVLFTDRFEGYLNDPDLKAFEADYALLLAREEELTARLDAEDSPEFRSEAVALMAQLRSAVRDGDAARLTAGLANLERHLKTGSSRDGVWEAILANSARRAALMKTAVEAQAKAENSFTPKEVLLLMTQMLGILRGEFGDPTAARLAGRFEAEVLGVVPPGRREPLALPAAGG